MESTFFHIIDNETWNEAQGNTHFAPDSMVIEGYIHLSLREQILRPANLLYHGRSDLRLLMIDAAHLEAEVVMEPGAHGEVDLFPHLYGRLNLDAVRRVIGFPCHEDGTFSLPSELD